MRTHDPVVTTLSPRHVSGAIESCIRADLPFFLLGQPGIGKSQIAAQVADRLYAADHGYTLDSDLRLHDAGGRFTSDRPYLTDIRAATWDTVDVRGVPTITNSDGEPRTTWAIPDELPRKGRGLIFLDEFNRANTMVQNACFSIVQDGKAGAWRKPTGYTVGAAGNRESDGGGVVKLPAALCDRFTFINVEVDNDDWVAWAIAAGIEPVLIAFMRLCPDLLSKFNPLDRVSPTPRSWEKANGIIKQSNSLPVKRMLLAGTVGEEAMVKYLAFEPVYLTMPSVDFILQAPDAAPVPGPTETNLRVAIASALSYRADDTNIAQVITYLNRLPGEYGAFATTDAITRDPSISHTREYIGWAAQHNIAARAA